MVKIFCDNTEIAEITENDGEQTANGSIEFDQGSDYVDQLSLTQITVSQWHHQYGERPH
ncbi:hypothetical protein [Vibrio sp.]|uniref:hypothetical protein n=1 Tax=Vibrio sp. TaxID=678 RepID=UPI003AA8EA49